MWMQKNGFSVVELLVVFTVITFIGLMASISYSGYIRHTERKLHVINAQNMVHMVRNGFVEGWLEKPGADDYIQVSLETLDARHLSDIRDPSSESHAEYSNTSLIHVYNNNAVLEYYVVLKKSDDDHTYLDTTDGFNKQGVTEVKDIKTDDILLSD